MSQAQAAASQTEPLTHEAAVDCIVDAIFEPPNVFYRKEARAKLREALLAITAPAKMLEELSGDLAAIRKTTTEAGTTVAGTVESFRTVELSSDPVTLEQQVAAWQAMALRISEEKKEVEKKLRSFADKRNQISAIEDESKRGDQIEYFYLELDDFIDSFASDYPDRSLNILCGGA